MTHSYRGENLVKAVLVLAPLLAVPLAILTLNWAALAKASELASIVLIIVLFSLSHLMRFARLYVLLLERRENVLKLGELYTRATLMNNILPFKLGEVYKVLAYGNILNDLRKGLVLVWIDRFFDTCILLIVIVPALLNGINLQITFITLLFVTLSVLIFVSFSNTFLYFNRTVLTLSRSRRGVIYLRALDSAQEIYQFVLQLIKGRSMILLVLSSLAWVFEYGMLVLVARLIGQRFDYDSFVRYLDNAFTSVTADTLSFGLVIDFSILLLFILLIILVAGLGLSYLRRKHG
ncbi:MAG: hypothetical protein TR69_WS6001001405 [candidate division WS6 bacterium OLB20]|uniref:Lysylphosphatidylglycerol synthase TM region n=1 Tax=candidate division WS6 bacterium OLB20 TaxID=1617426 RepID=A0A136LVY4_9BACT|nr:MAG: hypothetical protein TR69_WS6001001405 [candidate division WS6 bacterium OLB20]